jgi:hypothetical protein
MHVTQGAAALLALAMVMPAPARTPSPDLSLAQVIDRHVAARGGALALDAVRQIQVDLEIHENGQSIEGRYAADRGRLVRIDIYAEGRLVYREGVDSEGVWLWADGQPEPGPSTAVGAANALLHGAEMHLFALHRFQGRGHALSLMPPEILDRVEYQVVKVRFATGHTSFLYIDPESWLIARRRDVRAYHPDADETKKPVETRFSDFRTAGGIVYAYASDDFDLESNRLISAQRVTRIVVNPDIPPAGFDRRHAAPARLH